MTVTLTEVTPEHETLDWPPRHHPSPPATADLDDPNLRQPSFMQTVSNLTLQDALPAMAIGLGLIVVAIGAVLVWLSFGTSPAPDTPTPDTPALDTSAAATSVPTAAGISELSATTSSATTPSATAPSGETVIVHVAGQVVAPGIVEISAYGRVADAVEAAGGPLPGADLDQINLAAVVSDGSQILVPPTASEPADHGPPSSPLATDPTDVAPATTAGAASVSATTSETPQIDPTPPPETVIDPATGPAPLDPVVATPETAADAPETQDQSGNQTVDTAQSDSTDSSASGRAEPGEGANVLDDLEARMFDRETAPTSEEVQALLEAQGLGMPPELAAILGGLDRPLSDDEFAALLEQFGLGS